MMELRRAGETVILDDEVADALEQLAGALSKAGMAAKVKIQPDGALRQLTLRLEETEQLAMITFSR